MKRLPHLATDVDPTKLHYPLLAFGKLDGVRGLHITGKLTGRSLDPFKNLHTSAYYSDPAYTGFDGELTCGDIRGQSLCRDTTSAMNTIKGEPSIAWNLFDWLHPEVAHLAYIERYKRLEELLNTLPFNGVTLIPYTVVNNDAEREAFYEKCLDEGYEGAVYRDPEGLHKDGRATAKSCAYLREKPSSDKEAKVLRLIEAMENQNEATVNSLGRTERSSHKENKVGKGMVGSLVCWDDVFGEITVGPGKMTHGERVDFWNSPEKVVGQFIKYKSMDTGVKDAPRFARYICIRAKEDM